MHTDEDIQHFDICRCSHIYTCEVVLDRFPSPLQLSTVFLVIIKDKVTFTNLQLTHIEVHMFSKILLMLHFHQSLKHVKHVGKTAIYLGKMFFTLSGK